MSITEADLYSRGGINQESSFDAGLRSLSGDLVFLNDDPGISIYGGSTRDITPTGRSMIILCGRGYEYEAIGKRFPQAISSEAVRDRVYAIEKELNTYGVCRFIRLCLEERTITPSQLLAEYNMSNWDSGENENVSSYQFKMLQLLAQNESKAGMSREMGVKVGRVGTDIKALSSVLHVENETQAGVIFMLARAAGVDLRKRVPDDRRKIENLLQNGMTEEGLERLQTVIPTKVSAYELAHADKNEHNNHSEKSLYNDRPLFQQNESNAPTVDMALADLLAGRESGLVSCELDDENRPKTVTAKLLLATRSMSDLTELLNGYNLQFVTRARRRTTESACLRLSIPLSGAGRENVAMLFIIVNKTDEDMVFEELERDILYAICKRYDRNISLQVAAEYHLSDPQQRT